MAEGVVTKVDPMSAVTWEPEGSLPAVRAVADRRGGGDLAAGTPWERPDRGGGPRVARLPSGLVGRLAGRFFRTVLNGVEKDREHGRRELRYLTELVEHGRAG